MNALTSLSTLLALPGLSAAKRLLSSEDFADQAALPSLPGLSNIVDPKAIMWIVVLNVIYSIIVSTFCIIGGLKMYQSVSRPWAFTGAIACCFTSVYWPLGLIIGIASVILLIIDPSSSTQNRTSSATSDSKPRVSVMAIIAALLVAIPVPILLVSFVTAYWLYK